MWEARGERSVVPSVSAAERAMSPAARSPRASTAATAARAALAAAAVAALLPAAAAAAALATAGTTPTLTAYPDVFLRTTRALGSSAGCMYEGRWHRAGATVTTRDACLNCACGAGALQCRRRACATPPAPPPRCHLRYRRDACCPELHCPDGITLLENNASARLDDDTDLFTPISSAHVCVEDGAVFAAGSALSARAACEACFCLRGRRRCVRPRCLPPPPHCRAPPAPGACCPHRYYCDHNATTTATIHKKHDCNVDGAWASEGERVPAAERDPCTRCFCLRGAVHCQPPACAPPVPGCRPLHRAGDCCPHQYICEHHADLTSIPITQNELELEKYEDRSLHSSRSSKIESTTKTVHSTNKTSTTTLATENSIATTKVKRKANETPTTTTKQGTTAKQEASTKPVTTTNQETTTNTATTTKRATSTTHVPRTSAPITTTVTTTSTTITSSVTTPSSTTESLSTDLTSETSLTDQSEGSVKIVVNGTINCTAELSSTAVPANATVDETEKIIKESNSRVSAVAVTSASENQTSSPVDIITNGYIGDGIEDGDSFTINVTSSLNANTNRSTIKTTDLPKLTTHIVDVLNTSNKKTKGDYDYDYAEPTLPPSLPNLKIIPFVAADAVVDDEPPKESTYIASEREDKFPVYFPSIDTKDSFTVKHEDVSLPTQYPVFTPEKPHSPIYPANHNADFSNNAYPNTENDVGDIYHEYTITASLGNRIPVHSKPVTKSPTTTTTFKVPAVNLFSPPVETEGGFIPKGPGGIIDEYFAVYPSTPPGPPLPHLTTSMQLDNTQGECLASNGRRVMEGDSISFSCSVCTCAWGELHCSPWPCQTPPAGCTRRPADRNSDDLCCGRIVCDHENKTAGNEVATLLPTRNTEVKLNESKIPEMNTTYTENGDSPSTIPNNVTSTTPTPLNVSNAWTELQNRTDADVFTTGVPFTTNTALTTARPTLTVTNATTTTQMFNPQTTSTPPLTSSSPSNITDYEDEEEEEEDGFSFGNVLKLLLSESYDSTSKAPKKTYTTTTTSRPIPTKWEIYQTTTTTTRKPVISAEPFVPISHRYPYTPPKITPHQTSVNRIDHLVLGEATAIKKPTLRPPVVKLSTPAFKPIQPTTTQKPIVHSRPNDITLERVPSSVKQNRPIIKENSIVSSNTPPMLVPEVSAAVSGVNSGGGGGLLKLAGCNIYGRMYRVGRIITELSSACQECRCTDQGVQCRALPC